LSAQLAGGGDPERGLRSVEEGLAIARELGDPETLGVVLVSQAHTGGLPLRPEARLAIADELFALGERLGEPMFTLQSLFLRARSLRELDDIDGHDHGLDDYEARVRDHPVPSALLSLTLMRAAQDFLRGDLDGADRRVLTAYELATAVGVEPIALCGPMQFLVIHARGRAGELASVVEEQVKTQPGARSSYEAFLAVTYAYAARHEDARRIVEDAAGSAFASLLRNETYTSGLTLYAEAAELTGHGDAAETLLGLLEPYAGLLADNSASVVEPVDLAIAKAALTCGDRDQARASAERFLSSDAGQRVPVFRGRALIRLAATSDAGDRDDLVREALAIAQQTGAFLIERDAEHYGLSLSDASA
jgi:hypothetical protein